MIASVTAYAISKSRQRPDQRLASQDPIPAWLGPRLPAGVSAAHEMVGETRGAKMPCYLPSSIADESARLATRTSVAAAS